MLLWLSNSLWQDSPVLLDAACAATNSARSRTSSAIITSRRASWTPLRCAALAGTLMHTWWTCPALCQSWAALTCLGCWPQMHVVKNKLVDMGLLGEDLRVPLILGVWCALLSFCGSSMQIELVGSLLPHSVYAANSAGAYACF